jgi:hypothetical protein
LPGSLVGDRFLNQGEDTGMRWFHSLLALTVAAALTSHAPAITLFGKRNKVNPAQRVPELIQIVRTTAEERKRIAAVDELRQYDAGAFPQIVPVLAEVLKNDPSTAVRAEAAHSLGRLRPASVEAAQALEAAGKDAPKRVRFQARAALLFYPASTSHAAAMARGPSASGQAPVVTTAAPAPAASTVPANPVLIPVPNGPTSVSHEPPLASPTPVTPTSVARPLPRGPDQTAPQQAAPQENAEPPIIIPDPGQGPELGPPR